MFRKLRKAQWVYVCHTCEYTSKVSADMFGAQEAEWHHVRNLAHGLKTIGQAFQTIVDTYAQAAHAMVTLTEQFQKDYALLPPSNLPHDPALLRDRRKWGGR